MAKDNDKGQGFMTGLWNTVSGFFEAGFEKVWYGYITIMAKIWNAIITYVTDGWNEIGDPTIDRILNYFKDAGWIDQDTLDDLSKLKDYSWPWNLIFSAGMSLKMITHYTTQLLSVVSADIGRHLRSKYRSEDVQPREVIPAHFIAPGKEEALQKV